jgi:hypothetical protein
MAKGASQRPAAMPTPAATAIFPNSRLDGLNLPLRRSLRLPNTLAE